MSQHARDAKVYRTYKATSFRVRVLLLFLLVIYVGWLISHLEFYAPPVHVLKNDWDRFITTHESDAKFLQISHREGALHVYNALLTSPEPVRQSVISLAIAPVVIIPEELCFESYNHMSERDFITHLDAIGELEHGNELTILPPEAGFWNYDISSPIFESPLQRHITDYIENYGGKR